MMEDLSKEDGSEGPPRKRLLTDSNPQKRYVSESLESTVSFDSEDRLAKKTRELPNLSDCHGCAVRINYTNPRERLQLLNSMWRIVLLCKKCTKRLNSSDLCPYCFSAVVDEQDCFKCRNCQHSIHKDCVARLGSGLGFSVCVDCWVPTAVAKSIQRRKKKFRKKKNESCEQPATLPESRVSLGEEMGRRKVSVPAIASAKVADDPPLICYSRRRTSKKTFLMISSSLDVPLMCYSRLHENRCLRNPVYPPLMCYSRRPSVNKACSDDIDGACFISKTSKRTDVNDASSSAASRAFNLVSNSKNDQENYGRIIHMKPDRYILKYNRIGKGKPGASDFVENSDCCSCIDSTNLCTDVMHDTRDFLNGNECHEISENRDDDSNRFLLQYKRASRYKPEFSCKIEEFSTM